MPAEKTAKPHSSRVSDQVIHGIQLVSRMNSESERRVVQRGLDLVLEAAAEDEAELISAYNARLQAEMDNAGTLTSPSDEPTPAQRLRQESARFEVPTGENGVTCDVEMAKHRMLEIVGRWTGRNGSELVRHGLFLVFDDVRRKAPVFEKKLAEDFEADKEILATLISDPSLGGVTPSSRRRRKATANVDTAASSTVSPPATADGTTAPKATKV